jgi:diguanylate cyclase (GGDEF)-like protein
MEKLAGHLQENGIHLWLAHTHSLAALLDESGRILETNPALERLLAAWPGLERLESLTAFEDQSSLDALLRMALERGEAEHVILRLFPGPGGTGAEYDCSFIPLGEGSLILLADLVYYDPVLADRFHNLRGQMAQLTRDNALLQRRLVEKQIEIEAVVAQAQEVAHTDELTYLPNRRQIIGDLQREVIHSDRYRTPLSISMLDLDHFKLVNDSFGHTVGDQILREAARRLRDNIREPDIVGRYGGEEFLVILANSSLEAATIQAERLCRMLRSAPVSASGNEYHITLSAGVAEYRMGQEDWQKFLNRADAAMYQAKAEGRDRWAAAP